MEIAAIAIWALIETSIPMMTMPKTMTMPMMASSSQGMSGPPWPVSVTLTNPPSAGKMAMASRVIPP